MKSFYEKAACFGCQRTFFASVLRLGVLFFLVLELQVAARTTSPPNLSFCKGSLESAYTEYQHQLDQQVSCLSSNASLLLVPSECWKANFPSGSLKAEFFNGYEGFTVFVGEEPFSSCSEICRIHVADAMAGIAKTFVVKHTPGGGILIVDLED